MLNISSTPGSIVASSWTKKHKTCCWDQFQHLSCYGTQSAVNFNVETMDDMLSCLSHGNCFEKWKGSLAQLREADRPRLLWWRNHFSYSPEASLPFYVDGFLSYPSVQRTKQVFCLLCLVGLGRWLAEPRLPSRRGRVSANKPALQNQECCGWYTKSYFSWSLIVMACIWEQFEPLLYHFKKVVVGDMWKGGEGKHRWRKVEVLKGGIYLGIYLFDKKKKSKFNF